MAFTQRRAAAAQRRLDDEEAGRATMQAQLAELREEVAQQKRVHRQHLDMIELKAKSSSRATVDLEVLSAVAGIKAQLPPVHG